jgi:signal transduction histidine kinase
MNPPLAVFGIGLALGWLTLAAGWALAGVIRRFWRQHRYGAPVDHKEWLIRLGGQMAGAQDRQALARQLTEEAPRVLRAERAVLLLPEGHSLVDALAGGLSLPVNHAAVRWVTSSGEAQSAGQGRLGEIIRQGSADLGWTGAWIPLMRGSALRGMWLLGRRTDGLPYAVEDLTFLTDLSRQAAVILESLHLAEQEQRAAAEIRILYQRVVSAQETERGRLERDLHDIVLQDVCAISRDLKALEAGPATDPDHLAELAERANEMVHTLRVICNDLRPPLLQRDLATALRSLVEQIGTGARPLLSLDISGDWIQLEDETAVAVFRIAQEALRNAILHADASEIEIRLTRYPDRLRLTVTDDGRGIAGGVEAGRFVAQGHFGLAGMRERAAMIGAKFEVQSAPDYGTVVVLELPT